MSRMIEVNECFVNDKSLRYCPHLEVHKLVSGDKYECRLFKDVRIEAKYLGELYAFCKLPEKNK